jgi:DNA-binding MarR family transcriptional regulator
MLTPLGKKARRKLLKAANQHEQNLRQALGKDDSAQLFRMLRVLAGALTKKLSG